MISFFGPCLRYKLKIAQKAQWGFNGFLAPYTSKYLTASTTYLLESLIAGHWETFGASSLTQSFDPNGLPDGLPVTTNSFSFGSALPQPYEFPALNGGSLPPGANIGGDTFYTTGPQPAGDGLSRITYTITLSNPVTLTALDAACDSLLGLVSWDDLPWDTAVIFAQNAIEAEIVSSAPDGTLNAFTDPVGYTPLFFPPPSGNGTQPIWTAPQHIAPLAGASWTAFLPSDPALFDDDTAPGTYVKAIGLVKLAGNYCQKTFLCPYPPFPSPATGSTCQSGSGACNAPFQVNPPPPIPGQNAYVTITPDCQCP